MYGMNVHQAKEKVAGLLGITPFDLCDPAVMTEIRGERGFGLQMPAAGDPTGMAAKIRISDELGIRINSVEMFRRKIERK